MILGKGDIKSQLSKIKFKLGFYPKVEKTDNYRRYIPEPYKAVLIHYADFELAWAWRYSKELMNKKNEIKKIALRERKNVPAILLLCNMFNIPVTWATVGHLFLEECKKEKGVAHPEIPRCNYFENDYWEYKKGDWFDDDPCSNFRESPEWYCPDLIRQIIGSNTKHEIGCHTFSHVDCRDNVCTKEIFEAEIGECQKLSSKYGIVLSSFVHPGHTIGNLDNLSYLGLKSFRTDYGNILGYPKKHKSDLWEFKGTMELTYRKKWDINMNIEFYKEIIDRSIKNNSVCVYWFHPSFNNIFLEKILPMVFSYMNDKRKEIFITTVGDYTNWLNENIK